MASNEDFDINGPERIFNAATQRFVTKTLVPYSWKRACPSVVLNTWQTMLSILEEAFMADEIKSQLGPQS